MAVVNATDARGGRDVPLHERITAAEGALAPSERTVAVFLRDHPSAAVNSAATEIGRRTGTSDATVIRTVKALGYSGLPELKRQLVEAMAVRRDPGEVLHRRLDKVAESPAETVDQVLADGAGLLQQARGLLDPAAWQEAVRLIAEARAVLCYGIGPAGTVADFLGLSLARAGVPARAVTMTGFRLADALVALGEGDVVVLVAPLRRFREMGVILDHARSVRARVVLISETLGLSLEDRVDALLPAPESTGTAAGEVLVPLALCQALVLDVAEHDREHALTTHALLNRLREQATGAPLDLG